MTKTIPIIGLEPDELPWVRALVSLLRHPHPSIPELTRQALLFLEDSAAATSQPGAARAQRPSAGMGRVS